MQVYFWEDGEVKGAAPKGDLDSSSATSVQDQLLPLAQPQCKVLLEMSGVNYISSVGLRVLLQLYRRIANHEGHIVLTGLQEMVRDIMLFTGFLEFFEDYTTYEEGIAALREQTGNE